ncbi:MAG TPA: MFS transporter [Chryseosolibacter sp.]|nr:MFS transporter [Chryseosolibacter sp.]
MQSIAARILPTIVVSQFMCTSVWFAGNAVVSDITLALSADEHFLGDLTSAVQLGFISGTLVFALLAIADRFSPTRVFFICALIGAACNATVAIEGISTNAVLGCRVLTGFFLAGIYPVGMKIASDYYQKGLGRSLGWLVGALVVGTAFPHLLKSFNTGLPWTSVVIGSSLFAVAGGVIMMLLVPDGPHRKPVMRLNVRASFSGFSNRDFSAAASGYFGHMWELYTFWAFVPVMLAFNNRFNIDDLDIPAMSFVIIASGGVACVVSGFLSERFGAHRVAFGALLLSGLCCLLSPFVLTTNHSSVLMAFLIFWGMVVVADSPLFSSLVARHAEEKTRGSSLTIVNCVGFAITIASIQLANRLLPATGTQYLFLVLAPGPVFGLLAMNRYRDASHKKTSRVQEV